MDTRFKSPPRSTIYSGPSTRHTTTGATTSSGGDQTRGASGLENTDIMHSISTYQEYPANQPFIHDNYRRSPTKPDKAYPENNRQAVMSALKGLQDKIRQLELERSQAEENLRTLAHETSRYRDILQEEHNTSGVSPVNISHQTKELETQLNAAENRCDLLEKQLNYMRKMVQNSERDRTQAVHRLATIERQRDNTEAVEVKSQLDKVSDLEREYLKLTATQTLAENRIRELEERLKDERHQRKMMQEKTAEMDTRAQTNRIMRQADTDNGTKKLVKKKKKKKVVIKPKPKFSRPSTAEPKEHFHLNLAELPFVAGKSLSPSHSVPANVQTVLSLMKSHNPKLCSGHGHYNNGYVRPQSSSSSSGFSSGESGDFTDLLLQLQDEFGHMSFEHQELGRQIQEAINPRMREDLERELDNLVYRMEAKGDQIAKLRRLQHSASLKKKKVPTATLC